MRTAFIETLCDLAAEDDRIWLVTGDLGYSVLERFAERFPDRYVNAGVAEQNMTGVAAGLALSGKIVFAYSIANFPIMRCLEQVRNDVCYHGLNVKIVAVGGGFAYGAAGYTHYGVEDIAVMRALPAMSVVAPGDPTEARLLTRALVEHSGPCYMRLGKAREPVVHEGEPKLAIGKAILLREGSDLALMSTGGMLKTAVEVAQGLGADGMSVRVLSMHTVKPLDGEAVQAALRETSAVFTLEEHRETGGLGSAVAEVVAESGVHCTSVRHTGVRGVIFKRFGIKDEVLHEIGSQDYLRERSGLSPNGIIAAIREVMARAR